MRFLCVAALLVTTVLDAGDFPLVKNGTAANIVLSEYFTSGGNYFKSGFSQGTAYAALELADYAEKVTGVRPTVSLHAVSDRPNIYLFEWFWASNPPADKVRIPACVAQIKHDGFYLYADERKAYLIGRRPRAVMYGVYEILRKYGDVRWLVPGDEGESVIQKDSLVIPEQSRVVNPSFPGRTFNLVCVNSGTPVETQKWMMRNNMQSWFIDFENSFGGHIFSTLLPDTLFPEHPELFGLYNGKRLPQCGIVQTDPKKYGPGGQANQPCTSNPETRKIMLQNLLLFIGKYRADKVCITNNDSTAWCQCENCKKLDPPEEVKRHLVATRFWNLANFLITEAKKVYPDVRFITSAYQFYQEPPTHLKPVSSVEVVLCVHHRCYLHDIQHPACDLNVRYRDLIRRWKALGVQLSTYEYSNMMPRAAIRYLPLEGVLARDLKYYADMRCRGYCDEAEPYDGVYSKKWVSDRSVTDSWKANAMVRYVQAAFMWNADADPESVIEEFGSRYYGKSWPEIKQYRTLLRKAYEETDSHFLYGTPPMALGKSVADPKLFAELNALLDKAVKTADSDPSVRRRVNDEKEFFDLSFGALRKQYLEQRQSPCAANRVTGKIVIDGEFTEKDWQTAVPVNDFRIFNGKGANASKKTSVRVLWDENNLYFAVEASDSDMPEPKRDKPPAPMDDPEVWNPTNLEFFFTSPNFGYRYLHWVVNPQGSVWDALTVTPLDSRLEYNAGAEVRTKIEKNGWRAEIRMPFSALGGFVPVRDARIRVNIARSVSVNGVWEGSSWSYGAFHGPDGYREILFRDGK